jgi:hypothetical protein
MHHDVAQLARQIADQATEIAELVASAELPADVRLDVSASLAAAGGLLDRAGRAISAAGPGAENSPGETAQVF